jgi:NAD(P)-dependent dehydrogenase (short-subunit alcohol dehydrogenase family)
VPFLDLAYLSEVWNWHDLLQHFAERPEMAKSATAIHMPTRILSSSQSVTMAAYAPAKAGLERLTRLLAVHLGERQITVNLVRPGTTATDMNATARDPVTSRTVAETIALGSRGSIKGHCQGGGIPCV